MSYGKRSLSYACTQCRTYYVAPYYDLIVDAEGVHDPIRLGCRFAVDLRRLEAARARGSKRRLVEQFVAGGLIDLHRDDIALRTHRGENDWAPCSRAMSGYDGDTRSTNRASTTTRGAYTGVGAASGTAVAGAGNGV